MSCVVCIALGVDDCFEGVPACPYISGGIGVRITGVFDPRGGGGE